MRSPQSFATQFIRVVLAFLILPNAVFWVLGLFIPLDRAWFDLGYLAIGVLSLFLPRWVIFSALVLNTTTDLLRNTAAVYYFSVGDFVLALQFFWLLPRARLFLIVVSWAVLTCVLSWLILKISQPGSLRRSRSVALALAGVLLLLIAVDVLRGTNDFIKIKESRSPINVAGLSTAVLARDIVQIAETRNDPVSSIQSASDRTGIRELSAGGKHNYVVVMVEALGDPIDQKLREAVLASYKSDEVSRHYDLEIGAIGFRGSTIAAELRELCNIRAPYWKMFGASEVQPCVPRKIDLLGMQTVAIHGNTAAMYQRGEWYSKLGFERREFIEDLRSLPDMHMCPGPFKGICDEDIARHIGDLLATNPEQPKFIHWVTLNSHLPLSDGPVIPSANGYLPGDHDIGRWMTLINIVNDSVVKLALRPDIPPTEFLIVGDHAPPFYSAEHRAMFSQKEVPFIHLVPRVPATPSAHPHPQLPQRKSSEQTKIAGVRRGLKQRHKELN